MLNLMSLLPSNFGRYVSQTEQSMDKPNGINDWTQTQQKSTTNNIPSLMSITITSPIITTNIQQKSTIISSGIKENIEPLPFPQHGPGPIQRPNKLPCSPTLKQSTFFIDSTQSPSTPDVLVQINHLLDHQDSITTIPSTGNIPNSTNSSTIINDISTPNVPWTPFSPPEWPSKYDSSWSVTNIQSPNISLTTQIQNPFAQRQILREESSVWSSALGTATPRSTESIKSTNNSWLKFLPISDSSTPGDSTTINTQENETNNPFWNPINLNETQQTSSTSWWSKTPSDKNNNDNDQSRWDFAR